MHHRLTGQCKITHTGVVDVQNLIRRTLISHDIGQSDGPLADGETLRNL